MVRFQSLAFTLALTVLRSPANGRSISYDQDEAITVVDSTVETNHLRSDVQGSIAIADDGKTSGDPGQTARALRLARVGAYPFYGYWEGCGSSLIHKEFALTAAHCWDPNKINQTIVFDDGSVSATVLDLIVHPKYDNRRFDYDLMLVRISPPLTSVTTVDINTDPLLPNLTETMTVIGNGFIPPPRRGARPRRALMEAELTVNFPPRGCEGAYPGFDIDIMLCVTQSTGEASEICRNDAGGAILDSRGVLLAVPTAHSRCQSNVPWNTARVSEAADWIYAVICHLSSARPEFCGSNSPSMMPSSFPSGMPSMSDFPSSVPSMDLSETPSVYPSVTPSLRPTGGPTKAPSASPSAQPSIAPTVDPDCENIDDVPFFVEHLNMTKDCRWLSGRKDDMLKLCHQDHPAFHLCEDTCGKCADTCENANATVILPQYPGGTARTCAQLEDRSRDWAGACGVPEIRQLCRDVCTVCPVVTEPPSLSPTMSPTTSPPTLQPTDLQTAAVIPEICDDDHNKPFEVFGFQQRCNWLRSRIDRRVRDSSEYKDLDEETLSSTWREVLCQVDHPAYTICEETCGACIDDCEDDDTVAVAYYDSKGIGRDCSYLRKKPRNHGRYCPQARNICRETCKNCY